MFLQITTLGAILFLSLIETPKIPVLVICKTIDKGGNVSLLKKYWIISQSAKTLDNQPLVRGYLHK